jgi:predicted TPR repeat methyltransferase
VKSPIEDTSWGAVYGSSAAVQAAFDRFGPEYHRAILATGVPARAAEILMPFLHPDAQGIDLGCGSGVLGLALRDAGLKRPLDGVDLSPVMLDLARETGCYRRLERANLLLPATCLDLPKPYDFAITVGLIGDYVPYYVALPYILTLLKPGAWLGFAVEQRSTSAHALAKGLADLKLMVAAETTLPVADARLTVQNYQFFVVRQTSPQPRS